MSRLPHEVLYARTEHILSLYDLRSCGKETNAGSRGGPTALPLPSRPPSPLVGGIWEGELETKVSGLGTQEERRSVDVRSDTKVLVVGGSRGGVYYFS